MGSLFRHRVGVVMEVMAVVKLVVMVLMVVLVSVRMVGLMLWGYWANSQVVLGMTATMVVGHRFVFRCLLSLSIS